MSDLHHSVDPRTLTYSAPNATTVLTPGIGAQEETAPTPARAGDGGAETRPQTCLYFLVCEAEVGPLAGLFKLGIADSLALRHQQHRKVWGSFDLARSAVLRVNSRWEARRLELALRDALSGPVTEDAPGAAKPWSTADFIAMGSWRRYPGRRDEGYTEFYAAECLGLALAFTDQWLALCGRRLAGARLQRGIDPAQCALAPAEGGPALGGRDRGPRLRERQRVRREREYAELEEQVVDRIARALALALAHEERVLWVDLRGWQWRRREPHWFGVGEGLADLYFARFPAAAPDAGEGPQARFEEGLAPVLAWAASARPEGWRVVRAREVCSFRDLEDLYHPEVPHQVCAGALRLRVGHGLSDLEHPLFAAFAALARRVEDRHPWRQPELGC